MVCVVMVGVGTLQSLARAIFPGGLPWAGKALGEAMTIIVHISITLIYCWTGNVCS